MFNQTHLKRSLAAAAVAAGAGALPAVSHADVIGVAGPGAQPVAATHAPVARSVRSTRSGFVWGDAGIGASGALVLIGGGVAGAAALRRRRPIRAA